MTRVRMFVIAAAVLVVAASTWGFVARAGEEPLQALPAVTTYKDPGCGCCTLWVRHMEDAGFDVTVQETSDMAAVRSRYGVATHLQGCHTAVIGDYVVEGHVPADDVKRLLTEKPAVRGIAVPGMPIGSPGMEQGGVVHAYSTLAFDEQGRTQVFARH
jgi:hypothetical protein